MDERRGNQARRRLDGHEGKMEEEDADDMDEIQWWLSENNGASYTQITPGSNDGLFPSGSTLVAAPLFFAPL